MEIQVEHLCWTCAHYTFRVRPTEGKEPGWAFCEVHQKWFKDQGPGNTPAGMRKCPKWEK